MQPRQIPWKWLLLGLVALLVVGLVALPRQIGGADRLKDRVLAALSDWTGGTVTLTGPWQVRYFPRITVRGGLAVDDATRLPTVKSIAVKDAKITLSLPDLLLGRVRVANLRLYKPTFTLKEDAAAAASSKPAASAPIADLLAGTPIDTLRLRRAAISLPSERDVVTKFDASFDASGGDGTLSGFGSFDFRRETVRFIVNSGSLAETEDGPAAAIDLRLFGPLAATIKGTVRYVTGLPFDGSMDGKIADGRAFLTFAGVAVPDGPSLRELSASGGVHWDGSAFTFEHASFTVDGNTADGLLAITTGERPRIEGTLAFDRLLLDPYIAGGAFEKTPSSGRSRSDWALLENFDADLRISAVEIATSALSLGRGGFTISAKQGVLAAEVGELELCGGSAAARFRLDASEPRAKANLAVNLSQVGLDACLAPLAPETPLKGTGSLKADLSAEGQTVDEMIRMVSGALKLTAQNGGLPVDVPQLLTANQPLDGEGWSREALTHFDSLSADCRLAAGHIWCEKFDMQTQGRLISGAGGIDTGRQTLNWNLAVASRITPLQASQFTMEPSPRISIRGSWSQPMIRRADRPTLGEGTTRTSPAGARISPR